MGFYRGANVVTDGLVFTTDIANPKSYISGSVTISSISGLVISGSVVTGSLFNSPAYDASNGGSLYFNGTNNYVDFGRLTAIEGIPGITMCGWVKTMDVTTNLYPWIINTWFPHISFVVYQFAMNVNNTTFISATPATTDSASRALIPLNTWMYVCGTYDGNRCRIYWNGELKGTSVASAVGLTPTGSNSLIMGRASAGGISYINGYIASTSIYNRALSASEIFQNYNATKARFGL